MELLLIFFMMATRSYANRGQGALTAKYIYGPGIDEPISMERSGQTYYYHFDGLGSVTALSDSSGALTEQYSYDIFGNITSSLSEVGNPYYFTEGNTNAETALYYYAHGTTSQG